MKSTITVNNDSLYANKSRQHLKLLKLKNDGKKAVEMVPVFAYGILKNGDQAHNVLADTEFIGYYELDNYAMYDFEWYPGIVPRRDSKIRGEVYLVPKKRLKEMDWFGDEGNLFIRKSLKIHRGWVNLNAMVYVYGQSVIGRKRIESGEWITREEYL